MAEIPGATGPAEADPSSPRPIGVATLREDGTVVLDLRAEGPGSAVGDARFVYPVGHADREKVLRHVGGLKPGQTKPVPPW